MKKRYLNTILVAPDSFKGSMRSQQICDTIERAVRKESPATNVIKVPMADGGEGTVDSLVLNTGGQFVEVAVTGPVGVKVKAKYGILGDQTTAVIEMAEASGLSLVPEDKRDPRFTTTYGTGELIRDAISKGCNRVIMGIGGSATNDCGAGVMQALGFALLDKNGKDVARGGAALRDVSKIDTSGRLKELEHAEFLIACDVDNPLLGPAGATKTYGPQKGAAPDSLEILEDALSHFNAVMERDLAVSVNKVPGAGAAGGLGAGLMAFLGGTLCSGSELVMDHIQFEDIFKKTRIDLVITGEGSMDYQTAYGKLPVGVAGVAKKYGVPVVAVVGTMGKGAEDLLEKGINSIFSIVDAPMELSQAMERTQELLFRSTRMIIRLISEIG